MDTKLTKFNARFIIKAISIILVLLTVFVSSNIALSYLDEIHASNSKYNAYYLSDAVFNKDSDGFYTSQDFNNYVESYLSNILYYSSVFSDTTGKSFDELKDEIDEKYEKYKYNVLKAIYSELVLYGGDFDDCSDEIYSLLTSDIIQLKRTGDNTKVSSNAYLDYYTNDENTFLDFCVYDMLNDISSKQKENLSVNIASANKLGADLIIELPDIYFEDDDGMESIIINGGKYTLKINEKRAKEILCANGYLSELINYDSMEEAKESFGFDKSYKNINYIVKTYDGDVFTNVKDYKTKEKDLGNYLKGFTYYLTGSDSSFKSNYGSIYNASVYYYSNSWGVNVNSEAEIISIGTTSVNNMDVTSFYDESTYDSTSESSTHSDDIIKVSSLVVFFNDNAVFHDNSVSDMKSSYAAAGKLMRKIATLVLINILVFGILMILLMALSGKRGMKDEEIHLLPTDKIFFEIRVALSGVLIFVLGYYAVWAVFDYVHMNSPTLVKFIRGTIPYAVTLIVALLMDFILYFTRIVKAKRFSESFVLYRLIKWCLCFIFKAIKKLFHIIFAPLKAFVRLIRDVYDGKKAKNIKDVVVTKSVIIGLINIVLLLTMIVLALNDNGFTLLLTLGATVLLDVYMILRSLKFVGGVDNILYILHAYRSGNLEAHINRAALPGYLMPAAEDLEELGDGIKLAVDEAVKQETTKTELITNISHDLKTPLTSIINYVELLKQCDIQNDTARSYLEVLGEKSDRLKYLICDLVEASKAATGNIEVNLVDVSLNEIIAQIIGEHDAAFKERNLEVIFDGTAEDITVKADSKLLYRVLENLTVNVEKYAMPSTRVYISTEKTDTTGGIIIKNISAAPLNITPEQLKQRFVRGDAARTTEGNGLGLSIAENLCTAQGGKLDIDIVGDLFVAKVRAKLS